ncbi:MAG: cation-translocating P-type ATPase [Candidatus Levybacteria bacterium]|nr:cation-translocating P-type ATPase [Candidatus Levybacteria bacterium]
MTEEIKGLTSQEANARLATHGKNSVEKQDKNLTFFLLFSQYKNIISGLLIAATVFSLIIRDYLDAFFIFLVLIINGFFGFIQEYRAQKTLEKLKSLVAPAARVIREGKEIEIDAKEIVPGDIVVLREGDRVPADGKLITDVPIEVDEAILTGESMPIDKIDHDEIYSGTFIVRGRGYIEVTATGFETRLGQIAAELSESEKPQIPLARNLSNLGKRLAFIAIILAFLLVPIGVIQGRDFKEIVLIATSIAVAMIPEGLALVVTIALAIGAYRMVRRNTIVRKIAAIETLGATNVILADKTGTLTQNKMAVKKHWIGNKENLNLLLRAGVLGNTANLVLEEDGGSYEVVGDATDGAILSFVKEHIKDLDSFRSEGKVIEEKPFSPETKIIEVVFEKDGEKHVFIRGAPETIFKLDGIALEAHHEVDAFIKEGLRVIAFAHKKEAEKRFTFLGIIGIYDPPREEAKKAIKEASAAGIRIVMVTGDNPKTAQKIAEEVGLISEGELVVTHSEIENISDEELLKLMPKTRVFARMVPRDKLRLVRLYQKSGAVVAVTGDGVNDALALSEANIGVAMGETGTDVAKEAADMVITDDNLYTIVKAIEEGRGIYDNIIKTVVFLLSTNLSEFFVIFFSVIFGLPIPFTPTQILWINLVSDGAPAMALATDIKRRGLLKRKPRDISEQILSFARLRSILLITFVFSLVLIAVYAIYLNGSPTVPRLLIFNLLVVGEMIIIFIIRGGIFPINKFMIASILITLFLQYLVSTQPFLRALFRI